MPAKNGQIDKLCENCFVGRMDS